ncbi:MAG: HEPN domain-containing protein [Deltaproteobacteria bacterium]|nr:HEPN domain-containing protein [Deltaproteobacteria bacterium]
MKNKDLGLDYITRAGHRLAALEVLFERQSHADVVREGQEIVELCLKALLRVSGIEPPRSHDVSDVLLDNKRRLPAAIQVHTEVLAKISKKMRRDRELSFYGSEDLTPSTFYSAEDSQEAIDDVRWVYATCQAVIK